MKQVKIFEKKKIELDHKRNSIIYYHIFGNLMLLQCGNKIKYGFLPDDYIKKQVKFSKEFGNS